MRIPKFLAILLILLFLGMSVSPAAALSGCPKGRTWCDHPCRSFTDANGNNVCDYVESSSDQGSGSGSQSTDPFASENDDATAGSGNDHESLQNSPETYTPLVECDAGSIAETESVPEDSPDEEDSANTDQTSTDENASSSADESTQNEQQGSNPVSESFLSAITDPIFLVTLLLLLAAFLLTQLNYSLTARLGFLAFGLLSLGFYYKGCMCPVGVLANLPLHLTGILTGQYMLWLLLFLLPVLFIFLAGRIYCSGVCPFGAVQEFTFRIGTKLGLNQGHPGLQKLPWLRNLKYLALLVVLVVTPIWGIAWWCEIDPFYYLFNFNGTKAALYILIGLLIISLFVSRPWCRFLCPYGALLGILNKDIGLLKLKYGGNSGVPVIDHKRCKSCGKCSKTCPTDAIRNDQIDLSECINCGECSQQCRLSAIC